MSSGVVDASKRLVCDRCGGRLGYYRVAFTDDGVVLGRIRIPAAVEVWRDSRVNWERNVSPMSILETRYHWTCPCGAKPRWRATTLAARWTKRDATERV